jgi:hypothetical protein
VTLLLPRGLWGWLVDRFQIRLVPVGYSLRGLAASMTTRRTQPATPHDQPVPRI